MLTVITGPMFSGKSIEMIRQVNRSKIAGKRVIVFKFTADNRYSQTEASSYDGFSTWAIPASTAEEIFARVEPDHEVVAIDEIQFFDDAAVDIIFDFVKQGKEVIVTGLNLDFRGLPFELRGGTRTMADLLVRADSIMSLHAICTFKNGHICGAPATRTQRLRDGQPVAVDDPIVQIGSSESYEARCLKHHIVLPAQNI
ncbi:MAG: thymidine kinase [Candidatus Magasanikbacteria bacterium]|nr:thymidine kinase [Candidatus Magasanikbacteria bacterium]